MAVKKFHFSAIVYVKKADISYQWLDIFIDLYISFMPFLEIATLSLILKIFMAFNIYYNGLSFHIFFSLSVILLLFLTITILYFIVFTCYPTLKTDKNFLD